MVLAQKTSIQMHCDHAISLWWKHQMLSLSCWLLPNMTSTTGLLDYTTIRGLFCFTSTAIMNITASERHCGLVGAQLLSVIRWFVCDYATTMFASDFKENIYHRRSSEMSRDIYSVGVISAREPGKCRTWAALNPLCAGEDRITPAPPLTCCKSAHGVTLPSTVTGRGGVWTSLQGYLGKSKATLKSLYMPRFIVNLWEALIILSERKWPGP